MDNTVRKTIICKLKKLVNEIFSTYTIATQYSNSISIQLIQFTGPNIHVKEHALGFPGGSGVKNAPASAGHIGSSAGLRAAKPML